MNIEDCRLTAAELFSLPDTDRDAVLDAQSLRTARKIIKEIETYKIWHPVGNAKTLATQKWVEAGIKINGNEWQKFKKGLLDG